jgi:aminoglycoside phosphotransferase (APT) family kinase protein
MEQPVPQGFPAHLVPDATSIRHLTGGASRATWLAETPAGTVVVRVAPEGSAGASLALETALLRAAHDVGVPVPEVLAAEGDAMVMAYVEGEALAPKLLKSGLDGAVLAAECGRALARLHTIGAVEGLPVQEPVDAARDFLDAGHEPHPAIEIGLRWLAEHRPPPLPTAVVHGDFRLGNLMVDGSRLSAVLDWELAHWGDPREDLGWLCTKSWRFGRAAPVGGFADYAPLLDAYNAEAGTAVTVADVQWFEVLGLTRWAAICLFQAHRHVGGSTRSLELASLGRRVCEVEHDLLAALGTSAA